VSKRRNTNRFRTSIRFQLVGAQAFDAFKLAA